MVSQKIDSEADTVGVKFSGMSHIMWMRPRENRNSRISHISDLKCRNLHINTLNDNECYLDDRDGIFSGFLIAKSLNRKSKGINLSGFIFRDIPKCEAMALKSWNILQHCFRNFNPRDSEFFEFRDFHPRNSGFFFISRLISLGLSQYTPDYGFSPEIEISSWDEISIPKSQRWSWHLFFFNWFKLFNNF